MKAELDAPQSVVVTGRRNRLQSMSAWRSRWHTIRIVLVTSLITLIGFSLILYFFRNR
jgi:hypothetical protein